MTYTEILNTFANVARAEMRKDFRPDSCIAATRITIDVLERFGFIVQPIVVECVIFSKTLAARIEQAGRMPRNAEELQGWIRESGGYSVGIGIVNKPFAVEPGKLPIHVVVTAKYPRLAKRKRHILIDASIDQANRPAKGLVTPDVLITPVSAKFTTGRGALSLETETLLIRYVPRIADQTYKLSPNWNGPETRPATRRIIELIRAAHCEPQRAAG